MGGNSKSANARRYAMLKAEGRCTKCGKVRTDDMKNKAFCPECVAARKAMAQARKDYRIKHDLCVSCGQPLDLNFETVYSNNKGKRSRYGYNCTRCRALITGHKMDREERVCTACGGKFTIDRNASVWRCESCRAELRARAKALGTLRRIEEEERKRIADNIARYRDGVRDGAMVDHPCYDCLYSVSLDNGGRLYLPYCGAGCLKENMAKVVREIREENAENE